MSFTEYCQTWQFRGGYAAGVSDGKFKIIGQSWISKHILASINMKGDFCSINVMISAVRHKSVI